MSKLIASFACLTIMGLSLYPMDNPRDNSKIFYSKELIKIINEQVTQYGSCTVLHTDCINNRVSVSFRIKGFKVPYEFDFMTLNKSPMGGKFIKELFLRYKIFNL